MMAVTIKQKFFRIRRILCTDKSFDENFVLPIANKYSSLYWVILLSLTYTDKHISYFIC